VEGRGERGAEGRGGKGRGQESISCKITSKVRVVKDSDVSNVSKASKVKPVKSVKCVKCAAASHSCGKTLSCTLHVI
jgi:hypothetical protein